MTSSRTFILRLFWETEVYSVWVLGGNCARPMRLPDPSPVLDKIVHPWVQKFYPVLGLESGERLLWHFQTPVLYWINFSLRFSDLTYYNPFWKRPDPISSELKLKRLSLGEEERKRVVSKRVVLADVRPERKPERGYIRMFPRNENRNEGAFGCSPERKPERAYVCQNHPFAKPPFYLPMRLLGLSIWLAAEIYHQLHANLVFQACISFLSCLRKGNVRKRWQFPISFYRRVSHFWGFSDKSGVLLFFPVSPYPLHLRGEM